MPKQDKLKLIQRVYALRVQRAQVALGISQQALAAKQQDLAKLRQLQTEYQRQIDRWQSGAPQDLLARRAMLANLAPVLRMLQMEAKQLDQNKQRCEAQLRTSLVEQRGVEKLSERRAQELLVTQRRQDRIQR